MQRPGRSLVEPTVNRECSIVRLVRNLDVNAGGRFRQNERLANLKLLDHERSAFEKLRAGLNYQINKSRGWENNMVLDFVIFEESHVSAIQPGGPGGCRARQPHVEHSAAARGDFRASQELRSTSGCDPTHIPAAEGHDATASRL